MPTSPNSLTKFAHFKKKCRCQASIEQRSASKTTQNASRVLTGSRTCFRRGMETTESSVRQRRMRAVPNTGLLRRVCHQRIETSPFVLQVRTVRAGNSALNIADRSLLRCANDFQPLLLDKRMGIIHCLCQNKQVILSKGGAFLPFVTILV